MSLTINIYYTGTDGNARKFAEEMISGGTVERIRGEYGNEKYEYFYPVDDPETVLLIDRWKDSDALDRHHKSDIMKKIAELRKKYKLRMRVEKYTEVK